METGLVLFIDAIIGNGFKMDGEIHLWHQW